MTKKHFQLLAAALLAAKPRAHKSDTSHAAAEDAGAFGAWKECCTQIANTLSDVNPRFDRNRFMSACGVES